MLDSRACAHPLSIPGVDGPIPHAVRVLDRTFQNVSNDLHVAVRMHGKNMDRLYPVLIDYTQGAKSHEARIVVLIKGKCEMGIEPAEVSSARCPPDGIANHGQVLVLLGCGDGFRRRPSALSLSPCSSHEAACPVRYAHASRDIPVGSVTLRVAADPDVSLRATV